MEWLLSHLVSSFEFIQYVISWSIKYPGAAIFWATIWSVLLDWAVTKSPWGWDDMLWKVLKDAVTNALDNTKKVEKL